MFYSELNKIMWWEPPRIASRALKKIPKALGFTDNNDGHALTVINPDFGVLYPIRNPYSRAVSWWNLRHNGIQSEEASKNVSFEQFIKKENNEYFYIQPGHQWEPHSMVEKNNLISKHIIRYEYMVDDLIDIKFIKENFDKLSNELYVLKYYSRSSYRSEYLEQKDNPVCSFYTQELAEIVWERKKFEFIQGDYKKDSWKYLI